MEKFACYLVRKLGKDQIEAGIERKSVSDLPAGDVLIRVAYSSLNYKDAMAATGRAGVVRSFPHVPGIDAAGTVVESWSSQFRPDQPVLVTGYELGAERWGGWSEYVRVPADWVVPLPEGLSLEQSMTYGTAGFTAALCVRALQEHHIQPSDGEIVVTGATGGVGLIALKLLVRLGYTVVAVSGKADQRVWLTDHGASQVLGRDAVIDESGRPLLSSRWAGAVDTVGGKTLSTLLRSTKLRGCVAACGLVGGSDLTLTVFPFILRGVTLAGIDSAWCPAPLRAEIWNRLANDWRLDGLDAISTTVDLADIDRSVAAILAGQISGRVVIRVNPD